MLEVLHATCNLDCHLNPDGLGGWLCLQVVLQRPFGCELCNELDRFCACGNANEPDNVWVVKLRHQGTFSQERFDVLVRGIGLLHRLDCARGWRNPPPGAGGQLSAEHLAKLTSTNLLENLDAPWAELPWHDRDHRCKCVRVMNAAAVCFALREKLLQMGLDDLHVVLDNGVVAWGA